VKKRRGGREKKTVLTKGHGGGDRIMKDRLNSKRWGEKTDPNNRRFYREGRGETFVVKTHHPISREITGGGGVIGQNTATHMCLPGGGKGGWGVQFLEAGVRKKKKKKATALGGQRPTLRNTGSKTKMEARRGRVIGGWRGNGFVLPWDEGPKKEFETPIGEGKGRKGLLGSLVVGPGTIFVGGGTTKVNRKRGVWLRQATGTGKRGRSHAPFG